MPVSLSTKNNQKQRYTNVKLHTQQPFT